MTKLLTVLLLLILWAAAIVVFVIGWSIWKKAENVGPALESDEEPVMTERVSPDGRWWRRQDRRMG